MVMEGDLTWSGEHRIKYTYIIEYRIAYLKPM